MVRKASGGRRKSAVQYDSVEEAKLAERFARWHARQELVQQRAFASKEERRRAALLAAAKQTEASASRTSGFKRAGRLKRALADRGEDGGGGGGSDGGDTASARRGHDSGAIGSTDDASRIRVAAAAAAHNPNFTEASHPVAAEEQAAEASVPPQFDPFTVFVGDIDTTVVTDADLDQSFRRFGQIADIRMIVGKRFGFVRFHSAQAAQAAIQRMNGELVAGYRIRTASATRDRAGRDGTVHEGDATIRPPPSHDDAAANTVGAPSSGLPAALPSVPRHDAAVRHPPADARAAAATGRGAQREVVSYDDI